MAVVTSSDTAEVFEAAEEAFDAVAGFIKSLVVTVLHVSIFLGRDNGLAATLLYEVTQFIAVVATISNNGGSFGGGFETFFGGNKVADIAGRQNQNDGTSFVVCDGVNLAITASTRVSYAAICAPFLRPHPAVLWTLMCVLSMDRLSGVPASATNAAKMRANTPFSPHRA